MKKLIPFLIIVAMLFSCSSQEKKNSKFLKEHQEFCFALYDEFYAIDQDILLSFNDTLTPELNKKIRNHLAKNKKQIERVRRTHLKTISGKIPPYPDSAYEKFTEEADLLKLISERTFSDSLEHYLNHPFIQLKLIFPGTFSAFVASTLTAKTLPVSDMVKRNMVTQFTGTQIISKKKSKDIWQLYFNNKVVQLYSEYNVKTGRTKIQKVYLLKEQSK